MSKLNKSYSLTLTFALFFLFFPKANLTALKIKCASLVDAETQSPNQVLQRDQRYRGGQAVHHGSLDGTISKRMNASAFQIDIRADAAQYISNYYSSKKIFFIYSPQIVHLT